MRVTVTRLLFVAVLAFAVSAANASPTALRPAPAADAETHSAGVLVEAGDTLAPPVAAAQGRIAELATEMLEPPLYFARTAATRPLPAIPGAVFMTLAGFVCVSLIKDRRFWIAALIGLLYLGHVGLTALPELTWRLRTKKQTHRQPAPRGLLDGTVLGSRLRIELDGTRYIGLLRRLAAIPKGPATSLPAAVPASGFERKRLAARPTEPLYGYSGRRGQEPPPAMACLVQYPVRSGGFPVRTTGQHITFSAGFSHSVLARGPPL